MSKFTDFYKKAVANEAAKKEILAVLGGKKLVEATDEQLADISGIAKKLGIDITVEEMKSFASGRVELDDDELDAVAGGFDSQGRPDSIQDWYLLAREVNKYGGAYERGAEEIAKKHNLEPNEVLDNWFWFLMHTGL